MSGKSLARNNKFFISQCNIKNNIKTLATLSNCSNISILLVLISFSYNLINKETNLQQSDKYNYLSEVQRLNVNGLFYNNLRYSLVPIQICFKTGYKRWVV